MTTITFVACVEHFRVIREPDTIQHLKLFKGIIMIQNTLAGGKM